MTHGFPRIEKKDLTTKGKQKDSLSHGLASLPRWYSCHRTKNITKNLMLSSFRRYLNLGEKHAALGEPPGVCAFCIHILSLSRYQEAMFLRGTINKYKA